PVLGVGRLAADAEPLAFESGPPVYAVQAAGRAELAWAAYNRPNGELQEVARPSLSRENALVEIIAPGSIACGELTPSMVAALLAKGAVIASNQVGRIGAIGRLGALRLANGDTDNIDSLVPMYLREPAIGPQPPVPAS